MQFYAQFVVRFARSDAMPEIEMRKLPGHEQVDLLTARKKNLEDQLAKVNDQLKVAEVAVEEAVRRSRPAPGVEEQKKPAPAPAAEKTKAK